MTATADPFAPFLATLAEGGDPARFSDWLQDEFPCEPWAHAWSEFVRLGVECPRIEAINSDGEGRLVDNPRRSDLLARHGAEWARRVLGGVFPMVHAMRDYGHSGGSWDVIGGVVKWDWGVALPESFKFPTLAAWTGERCPNSGHRRDRFGNWYVCHSCDGSGWQTPPVGPALARRVPLRRVEFADKRPLEDPSGWFWHDESDPGINHTFATHSDLPQDLYKMLDGPESFDVNSKRFPTEAAANAALSDAAIRCTIKKGSK